jgi:hypothetical protein
LDSRRPRRRGRDVAAAYLPAACWRGYIVF